MSKTAALNIRLEPETKAKAEMLFSKFGITLSDAVSLFFNQSIIEGGFPFKVCLTTPNAVTAAAMREAEANTEPGRFATAQDMFDDLGI